MTGNGENRLRQQECVLESIGDKQRGFSCSLSKHFQKICTSWHYSKDLGDREQSCLRELLRLRKQAGLSLGCWEVSRMPGKVKGEMTVRKAAEVGQWKALAGMWLSWKGANLHD